MELEVAQPRVALINLKLKAGEAGTVDHLAMQCTSNLGDRAPRDQQLEVAHCAICVHDRRCILLGSFG